MASAWNWKAKRRTASGDVYAFASVSSGHRMAMATSSNEGELRGTMFQNTTAAAATKMFHINVIREKILFHVIHDDKGKLAPKMVKAVRLVEKSWLETTTKLLRKSEKPVIELTLTKDNSRSTAEEVKTKGKLLDRFVRTFTDASRMEQSFLPFKLVLKLEYFHKENYQSLMDCFTRLGDELVDLEMTYPIDGGAMPLFTFPLLRKLSFQLSDGVLQKQGKRNNFGDNESGFWLLQSILSGCKDLKKLDISFADGYPDLVPKSIGFLRLPDKISCLSLGFRLKSKELEALVFQLSNLNHLKILTHKIPYEGGLLFKILERFQASLTKFHVIGPFSGGRPFPHTFVRFSLMEKMKTVIVDSLECELEPWDILNLRTNLPKLSRVELTYQTEPMLAKWFQNLNGDNVELLTISVVDGRLEHEHDNFYKSPSLEMMTQVYIRFPNLYYFVLDLNISDLTVLKYLFENMIYLRTLRINLRGKLEGNGGNRLDSILLGQPSEVISALRFLKTFEFKNDLQPCITNLSELRNLFLWTNADTEGGQTSLISDLLFSHGFLKMPKLRNLYLYGKFKPTSEMEKQWNDRGGGQMKYSAED